MNSLNAAVMSEFGAAVEEFQGDSSVSSAVLISGKPGVFIAGADITMLAACKTKEEVKNISVSGQNLLAKVAASRKPIVAAIMGPCLGGGLEVSLLIVLSTFLAN